MQSPGVWRVGFGGITGLDWVSARCLHDDDETWPSVREALRFVELGALAGAARRAKEQADKGGEG
jgi:hypothetical protein